MTLPKTDHGAGVPLVQRALRDLSSAQGLVSAVVEGLSAADCRRREAEDRWSMLEILHHLWDEEREDFRVRIRHLVEKREGDFPAIDPEGWVKERKYNEQPLERVVRGFLQERNESLLWLRGLGAIDWGVSRKAPWGGELSAHDLLMSWRAHDLIHARQLLRCRYWLLGEEYGAERLAYAGKW